MFELVSGLQFGNAAGAAQLTLKGPPNSGANPNPFTMNPPAYEGSAQAIKDELAKVLDKAALRPDRLSEILTQVANPYAYFSMVLNLQPGRHRHTFELMAMLFALTDKVVMQFKHFFRIRRPADRSQLVQPVLLTPSHGSYPAGHAVQSNLVAAVLKTLVGAGATSDAFVQLTRLADRIGENRVIAGVHYPADIDAGKPLGEALSKYVQFMAGYPGSLGAPPALAVNWLWRQAWAEWH